MLVIDQLTIGYFTVKKVLITSGRIGHEFVGETLARVVDQADVGDHLLLNVPLKWNVATRNDRKRHFVIFCKIS